MCQRLGTILEGAVVEGMADLSPEAVQEEMLRLHRQVGALEQRNARLEDVIKAMCQGCALRRIGSCDWLCLGRDYNDTAELQPMEFRTPAALYGQA